jgi:hypothetical protein
MGKEQCVHHKEFQETTNVKVVVVLGNVWY